MQLKWLEDFIVLASAASPALPSCVRHPPCVWPASARWRPGGTLRWSGAEAPCPHTRRASFLDTAGQMVPQPHAVASKSRVSSAGQPGPL